MVLLDDVVEVTAHAQINRAPSLIFLADLSQTSMGRSVPIDVDLGRPADICSSNCGTEKCLRGLDSAILAKE
jgi:hypothetical protein